MQIQFDSRFFETREELVSPFDIRRLVMRTLANVLKANNTHRIYILYPESMEGKAAVIMDLKTYEAMFGDHEPDEVVTYHDFRNIPLEVLNQVLSSEEMTFLLKHNTKPLAYIIQKRTYYTRKQVLLEPAG